MKRPQLPRITRPHVFRRIPWMIACCAVVGIALVQYSGRCLRDSEYSPLRQPMPGSGYSTGGTFDLMRGGRFVLEVASPVAATSKGNAGDGPRRRSARRGGAATEGARGLVGVGPRSNQRLRMRCRFRRQRTTTRCWGTSSAGRVVAARSRESDARACWCSALPPPLTPP